ncbi:MAG: phospholipase D-like domain-containing protein [Rhabdochlamydiaceae bacterium]
MKKSKHLCFIGFVSAFFVFLSIKATSPSLPNLDHPLIFYSNHTRDDLKLVVLKTLKQAKKKIFVHIYSLSDPDVLFLIEDKAQKGCDVEIFFDPSASPLPKALSSKIKTKEHIAQSLMHRKIICVDDQLALIGSANLTPQSLKMHDNLMVGFYHPALANFLQKQEERAHFYDQENRFSTYMLPHPKALEDLLSCIDKASQTIKVCLFTLSHPKIVSHLVQAVERGVEVSCILDRYTAKGASKQQAEILKTKGVKLYTHTGSQLFHHKWALIDNTHFILGSANWTKAAFKRNKECLVIFDFLSFAQQKKLTKIWTKIKNESVLCI